MIKPTKKIEAFLKAQSLGIPIFGDIEHRDKDCPQEFDEQMRFFSALRKQYPELAKIAIHVKNEGSKNFGTVKFDRMMGQVKGASDIIIPGNPAFVCELKRQDANLCTLSDEQINYLLAAQKNGAFVCIALGFKYALAALQQLKGE